MDIIPRPRYDGVRTLADTIIDAVFGEPLRRVQRWVRSRAHRSRLTAPDGDHT